MGSNPAGDIFFILNFSLSSRSEQLSGANADENKHNYSPLVIVGLATASLKMEYIASVYS